TGKIIITPTYDATKICDGIEVFPMHDGEAFDYFTKFSEGLAVAVLDNGLCSYIDKKGNLAINKQFFGAHPFSENLAVIADSNKEKKRALYGFIDKAGDIVIKPQFDVYLRSNANAYKFVNAGRFDSIPEFSPDFHEGLASVSIDGRYGYIDKKG